MGLPQTDFELVRARHQCVYCHEKVREMESIRQGAEKLCPSSRILLACLQRIVPQLLHNNLVKHVIIFDQYRFQVTATRNKFYLELFELDASSPIAGRLLPGSTDSMPTFATIQTWLEDCLTSHGECGRPSLISRSDCLNGIRFLEIRGERLRLLENTHPTQYVCLSHCWGTGEEIFKTEESSVQAHLGVGIPLHVLPQTFKDAVNICRRLNINTLWIDSLCIIQDNNEDWLYQSARMADIYENAVITIAASASQNPTQGCFRNTGRSYLGEPLPGEAGVYVRCEPKPPGLGWPLLERAWVFQEVSLSPRVVHFGPHEVVWQCRSRCVRESQPNEPRNFDKDILIPPSLSENEHQTLSQSWYKIVSSYTGRSLTYGKDRLPAIAAMARRRQSLRPNDRYLAGLWQSSLCFDLLWHSGALRNSSRTLYQAIEQRIVNSSDPDHLIPTWSWASIQDRVSWSSADRILSCVEVLDIAYSIRGPSVSGEILEAAITLRAPLLKFDGIRAWNDVHLQLEDPLISPLSAAAKELVRLDQYWDGYGPFDTVSHVHSQLFVLALAVTSKPELPGSFFGHEALLVKQTERPGIYIRLGVVDVHFAGWYAIHNQAERLGGASTEMLRASEEYNSHFIAMLEASKIQIVTLV